MLGRELENGPWTIFINRITQFVAFGMWLIGLSMFSRFIIMEYVLIKVCSFYCLVVFRCVDIPHIELLIHSLIGIWVVSSFGLPGLMD